MEVVPSPSFGAGLFRLACLRHLALPLFLGIFGLGTVHALFRYGDETEELIGRQVVVVTGFEPVRIGGYRSDVLVLGALTNDGVVLVTPDEPVPPGATIV